MKESAKNMKDNLLFEKPEPVVQGLVIEITGNCNGECKYCYSVGNRLDGGMMSRDDVLRILLEANSLGCQEVKISGGEPLLHPHVNSILESALAVFARVYLLTNGAPITPQVALKLAALPGHLFVQVSLDSADEAINDEMRGMGAYGKAVEGIVVLVEAGLGRRLSIRSTLSSLTVTGIEGLVRLARSFGTDVRFAALTPVGKGRDLWSSLGLSADDYLKAFDTIVRLSREYPDLRILQVEPRHRCRLIDTQGMETYPVIRPEGDTYLCPYMDSPGLFVGNAVEQSLRQVILGNPAMRVIARARRKIGEIVRCRECLWHGPCQGGCPGLALILRRSDKTDGNCDARTEIFARQLAAVGNARVC